MKSTINTRAERVDLEIRIHESGYIDISCQNQMQTVLQVNLNKDDKELNKMIIETAVANFIGNLLDEYL
jgi:hypothetical protein